MKTYCVTLAQDIPHYAFTGIEAEYEEAALAAAKALDPDEFVFDADWTNPLRRRIVVIEDEQGRTVAVDVTIDRRPPRPCNACGNSRQLDIASIVTETEGLGDKNA